MAQSRLSKLVGRRLADSSAGGLLYGAIVTAAVLVTAGAHEPTGQRVVVVWAIVIVTYWLTHVYVHAAERQFHDDHRHLLARSITAARAEVPVLLGGIPAMIVFVVADQTRAHDPGPAMIALLFTVVLLAVVGYTGTRYAGRSRAAACAEAAGAAALGLVMVAAKSLLH